MRQLFVVEHLAVSKSSLAIQISWKYSFCELNNQYNDRGGSMVMMTMMMMMMTAVVTAD